jgi:hypothetical protein
MRIKSRALNLLAEDYFNDKVLEDTDILYTGTRALPDNFWDKHGKGMESWKKDSKTYYKVTGPLGPQLLVNEFVWLESDGFAPSSRKPPARLPCWKPWSTTRIRKMRSGASPPATASRISR